MSDSGDLTRQEDVVRRLREMHATADITDQPRAALYLGLAITDLLPILPDDAPRRGELATEGLSRLDEADGAAAAEQARKLLRRYLPPGQEPVPLRFTGADMSWDMDWGVLREPAEIARNLMATLSIASGHPAQAPLRRTLTAMTDLADAANRGEWSDEQDAVLTGAIREVEAADLGPGLGLVLRLAAMQIRVQRCHLAEQQGGRPRWPPLAELDELITGLESDDDLNSDLGGPFRATDGVQHCQIANLIMMRIMVDIRGHDAPRDIAWLDSMFRLLDRVDDHLGQAPSAYIDPVRLMRASIGRAFAPFSRETVPPAAVPDPASPPPGPASGRAGRPAPGRTETVPSGTAADTAAAPSWSLDSPLGRILSPQVLKGVETLAKLTGGPILTSVAGLASVSRSLITKRWSEEAEQGLAAIRQQAERLEAQPESSLSDRATVTAVLAMARAAQRELIAASPRPEVASTAAGATDVLDEVEAALELLTTAAAQFPSVPIFTELPAMLHGQAAILLTNLGRPDGDRPDADLIERARDHMARVPAEMLNQLPGVVRDTFLLKDIAAAGGRPDPAKVAQLSPTFRRHAEESGADLSAADAAVATARKSKDLDDIVTAIGALNKVAIALLPGSRRRARLLISLAEMQTMLAAHTGYPLALADAAGSAIEAIRAASESADVKSAVQRLVNVFILVVVVGGREEPFEQAEELLREVLAAAGAGDWPLRVIATVGTSATVGARATAAGDPNLHQVAAQLIGDAQRLLPAAEPTDTWYDTARILYTWTSAYALYGGQAELAPMALRLTDTLENVLVSNQERIETAARDDGSGSARAATVSTELAMLREGRKHLLAAGRPPGEPAPAEPAVRRGPAPETGDGGPSRSIPSPAEARTLACRGLDRSSALLGRAGPGGGPRRPLAAAGRPSATSVHGVSMDLHTALAGLAGDLGLRRLVDTALGLCAAELYWADPATRTIKTLQDAVVHLNRALTSGEHVLPTTERAELLDVLARCWHEAAMRPDQEERERAQARAEAGRAARAAVRELARCVLLTEDIGRALGVAARAGEVVARSVSWCLADGDDRAAVEMAEAGRGLVLAGVVLTGRVEEVLRGAGKHDVADGWRQGGEPGRIAALDALWETSVGMTLLAAPTADEVSVVLGTTDVDALVYLVPPPAGDHAGPGDAGSPIGRSGHAVLVRPLTTRIEVLPLPGLANQDSEPLTAYLAALDNALVASGPGARNTEGFRGGPRGQAWADALVRLGYWAHGHIMGPVIDHVRGWNLDHRPHLALIPLGDLAAVPYATAWTDEAAPAGARRYAIEDVVLSYAASARLLGEVARRPRLPLTARVVLVSDPSGMFPMARRAAKLLASHQYPGAEVYGPKTAPNGPATTAVLLGALPALDRPGASLLQLSTHAAMEPTPRLQSRDGWLPLSRILEQGRNRPPDAPGGLVITNACLTDSTRTNPDESLTLTTAFLAAGATAIIGTRWPVDDDTATALSLRLHYHLQMGTPSAEALRYAQLDLLRPHPDMWKPLGRHLAAIGESRLSHPASWAGYVHHGI